MKLKFKHFIFLNALDVLLSWYAFTQTTSLRELNPFYIALFSIFGVGIGLIVGKIILNIVIWVFYSKQPENKKINNKYNINVKKTTLYTLCIFMCFVVLNNIYQIIDAYINPPIVFGCLQYCYYLPYLPSPM